MAIQVNGTTVIDNSRNLTNVGGLKTVGGSTLIGSGNITTGSSTAVNGVGTYINGFDHTMSTNYNATTGFLAYKSGRTTAGSNIQAMSRIVGEKRTTKFNAIATATGGNRTTTTPFGISSTLADYGGTMMTDNQTFSGTWRFMGPAANGSGGSTAQTYGWAASIGCLMVRIS